MAPLLIALIPGIFNILEKTLGSITDVAKIGLVKGFGALEELNSSGILNTVEGLLGSIESTKKALIQAQIEALLSQSQIVEAEITSPKPWYKIPHEIVEMCADVYLGTGFLLSTLVLIASTLGIPDVSFIGFNAFTASLAITFSGGIKAYKALTG